MTSLLTCGYHLSRHAMLSGLRLPVFSLACVLLSDLLVVQLRLAVILKLLSAPPIPLFILRLCQHLAVALLLHRRSLHLLAITLVLLLLLLDNGTLVVVVLNV